MRLSEFIFERCLDVKAVEKVKAVKKAIDAKKERLETMEATLAQAVSTVECEGEEWQSVDATQDEIDGRSCVGDSK